MEEVGVSGDLFHVYRILSAFLTYALVLVRTSSLVLFAPFLSSEVFSTRIRLGLAMVFPLLLLPTAAETSVLPAHMDMVGLALAAGQEFALGMAIAFLGTLVFNGVQMAGEIAGQQIGFSMASVMDPQSGIEMPMLGFINMNLTIMMFITAKLHLVIIYIMSMSYRFIGIGAMVPDINFNNPVLEMGYWQMGGLFNLGVRMAAPVIFVMMLNSIVEGFITKTMPQMNIQVLGMPLRVVVGLNALIFLYPAICAALVPSDWLFNLSDMPDGPIGDMLMSLSLMVARMGQPNL